MDNISKLSEMQQKELAFQKEGGVNMKVLNAKRMQCPCCMEEHEVQSVIVSEDNIFKGVPVTYDAEYLYCDRAEETYADEQMISANDIAMKNAFREKTGLLTTGQIAAIRSQFGISQSDLCHLLGWGAKTITRYESHQVQDIAHDTTPDEKKELDNARKMPITFDADCPETTHERALKLKRVNPSLKSTNSS